MTAPRTPARCQTPRSGRIRKVASCAAGSVAKPPRSQRARPRCCTCRRVLPTTDTMPASRGSRGLEDSREKSHGEPRRAVRSREEHSETGRTRGRVRGRLLCKTSCSCPRERAPHHQPYPRLLLESAKQTTVAAVGPKRGRCRRGWACPGKSSCDGQMGQWRARLGPGTRPQVSGSGPRGRDQAIYSMYCSGLSRSRIVFSTCG